MCNYVCNFYASKEDFYFDVARVCPHFKSDDKNEINDRQIRKIAQIISRY